MAESAITEIGARDRLVMTGLVLLGLLTVIAGVLSGDRPSTMCSAGMRAKPR